MSSQFIIIDDSGDPGFKPTSSPFFVMAAIVFNSSEAITPLVEALEAHRRSLGWCEKDEFKFAKNRKEVIVAALKAAVQYNFQIYAVYIDKNLFRNVSQIIDGEKLYNWSIKELLEIIPFSSDAKIKIDGRSSKANMRKTVAYLRHHLNSDRSRKVNVKFEDSIDNILIQLADLIAGSINRSFNKDKTDAKTYLKLVEKKVIKIERLTN